MSPRGKQQDAYAERKFIFPGLKGTSPKAIRTHLDLYGGYVKEANAIAASLGDAATVAKAGEAVHARESLARRLAFELSGVRLHELLFEQFRSAHLAAPPARNSAWGRCVAASFGTMAKWSNDISTLGKTRGPGWVVTYWDGTAKRLDNLWVDLHHLAVPAGQKIVFVLDLWEHAYWDDFGAKGRPEYIRSVLGQTNWSVMDRRLRQQ